MKSRIKGVNGTLVIDGATIRVYKDSGAYDKDGKNTNRAGIVSILPKVQIAIGEKYGTFMKALELSRLPLALKRDLAEGKYETYKIYRLQTGNIKVANIATLMVYSGYIVGITYSKTVLSDKEFRRLVKLSSMHQLSIPSGDTASIMFNASTCISILTNIDRDRLMVAQTAKSIKVKVPYKSKFQEPVYYTFVIDEKAKRYKFTQVAYDLNSVARKINSDEIKI